MSPIAVDVERRLLIPISDIVALVRKHHGISLPDDCRVCVGDTSYPTGAMAMFCWTVREAVPGK